MKGRWWLALAGIATVLGLTILPQVFAPPVNLALLSKKFYRSAYCRLYAFNQWTMVGETPTTVGNALASFMPSFVTGSVRFEQAAVAPGATIPAQIISDMATIQSVVKAANPTCIFDLTLRANKFADFSTTGASIVAAMQLVRASGIQFDAWSFDNLNSCSAQAQMAIFNEARMEGKLVGGEWYLSTPPAVKFDWILTNDVGFLIPSQVMSASMFGIPLLLTVNNGPTPVDSTNNTEHYDWNFVMQETNPVTITFTGMPPVTVSRASVVTAFAQAQQQGGFAFAYNLGWPEGNVGPPSTSYVAWKDGMMLQRLINLATTYNVPPK